MTHLPEDPKPAIEAIFADVARALQEIGEELAASRQAIEAERRRAIEAEKRADRLAMAFNYINASNSALAQEAIGHVRRVRRDLKPEIRAVELGSKW